MHGEKTIQISLWVTMRYSDPETLDQETHDAVVRGLTVVTNPIREDDGMVGYRVFIGEMGGFDER